MGKFVEKANQHKKINFDSECLEKNGAQGKYHRRNTDEFNFDLLFTEKQKRQMNYHLEELNKTLNYAIPGYYLFENVDLEAAGSPLGDLRRPKIRNAERNKLVGKVRASFNSLGGLPGNISDDKEDGVDEDEMEDE